MASWDVYYKVFITPRSDVNTYGTELEISDHVNVQGISSIRSQVDSTDYDIGAFKYDDVTIKGVNRDGYFNDETDKRSIFFPFSRDLAKVRIVFTNSLGDTITFRGLLNEEATKTDFKQDLITFRVLSLDSGIRNTQVQAGTIPNGTPCTTALASILNVPSITSALNYDVSKINVGYNFTIDDGTKFDNLNTKDVLNSLLLASNSVMTIDATQTMVIKDRSATSASVLNLYGPYDAQRRQNVVDLKDHNTGKQRMFNSFLVNTIEASNTGYIRQYGFRQKSITFDFITSDTTAAVIAANLLADFQIPKIELQLDLPTYLVKDSLLLDPVSLNWPLLITPVSGTFMPVIDDTKIGDSTRPLPNVTGSLAIDPNVAFKILELSHNPSTFISTVKLRQQGTTYGDGYYNQPGGSIVGFCRIDDGVIAAGSDTPLGNFIGQAIIGSFVIG